MPGMQILPPFQRNLQNWIISQWQRNMKSEMELQKNWQYTSQAPAVATETRANWIVSPSEKITQVLLPPTPFGNRLSVSSWGENAIIY